MMAPVGRVRARESLEVTLDARLVSAEVEGPHTAREVGTVGGHDHPGDERDVIAGCGNDADFSGGGHAGLLLAGVSITRDGHGLARRFGVTTAATGGVRSADTIHAYG